MTEDRKGDGTKVDSADIGRRRLMTRFAGTAAAVAVGTVLAARPAGANGAGLTTGDIADNATSPTGFGVVAPSRFGFAAIQGGDPPLYSPNVERPAIAGLARGGPLNMGVYGLCDVGYGVYGRSDSSNGVAGRSQNANGVVGVSAQGDATKAGVFGVGENGTPMGVLGTSTTNYGVKGTSSSNYGVYGVSQTSYGAAGRSNSGFGVVGVSATGNATKAGVWGQAAGGNAMGVLGTSTANFGVKGTSSSNYGVYGVSASGSGVAGRSTSGFGVIGVCASGGAARAGVWGVAEDGSAIGVLGTSTSNIGVQGTSTASVGVKGTSTNDYGVYGTSTGSYGTAGRSVNSVGVVGVSASNDGVFGTSEGVGVGGRFGGGRANLNLTPMANVGRPTSGAHQKGDVVVDANAAVFVCTAAGTPGTWVQISTTPA